MTTFGDAISRATALLYKVVWWPENWSLDKQEAMTSYVVAMSMDEAGARLSENKYDIKSVTMMGHIIERTSSTLDVPREAP
jgi:hypothetical protein